MRALVVSMTLLAGPANNAVAVQWRGAEPDSSSREAVREAVAGVDGRPLAAVRDHALDRARLAVSRELPASVRELRTRLREGLDEADAAYREGRFADARALLEQLLDSLHAHPELPGAAASAREAHLLAARIAWAEADTAAAERALSDALRLDPEARLSPRRAPPELIERYEALQAALLAGRADAWVTPQLELPSSDHELAPSVEIDGVAGLRSVPPGPHFVVVFRDGHEPAASWLEVEHAWAVPPGKPRVSDDPDREHQAICDALALELLLLAEQRDAELGLQAYRCGVGYGPIWTGKREGLPAAASTTLAGPFDANRFELAGAWAAAVVEPPAIAGPEPPPKRPWYRRGWIWGTSAGAAAAIAGGVAAGVLLGGRSRPATLEIDADDFIAGGER